MLADQKLSNKKSMLSWISRIGYLIIALSIGLYLSEFLPVDLWEKITSMLSSDDSIKYHKIVSSDGGGINSFYVAILGVLLVAFSKAYAFMRKN